MKRLSFIPFGLVLSVLVAAMLGGCIDERYTENAPSEDEVQLLVELNVAGVSTAAVRAHSAYTEKLIDKLDVLVFEVNGSTETFAYKTHGVLESGTKYKVNLKKSIGSETYTFVFLANLREEVTTAVSTFNASTSKVAALEAITFDAFPAATPTPWVTTGTSTRYLPMWGKITTAYTVDATMPANLPEVSMLRAVARVDILLNPASTSTPESLSVNGFSGNFTLTGVKVHNVNATGTAVPQGSVAAPATPTILQTNTRGNYRYSNLTEDQKEFGMRRDIYIAEGTDAQITDESAMTCVVIEITNSAGKASWYRLDFIKNPATGLRWDIVRNYCYTFNITSITGLGYASPEEAFSLRPVNLNYNIVVNESDDESAIKEVVFNGQYMLGVSQKEFALQYEKHTNCDEKILYIDTNYKGGWKLDGIVNDAGDNINRETNTNDGWLGIVDASTGLPVSEGTEGITKVKLAYSVNIFRFSRTGYIRISLANGLSMEIEVEQEEITVQDGKSNCYMVAPDHTIAFHVTRAIDNGASLTATFTPNNKLWDDGSITNSAVAFNTVIDDVLRPGIIDSHYITSYIVVTGGVNPGNALVAAKVGDEIYWSYHIWVTGYTGAETWENNGFTFMDRNLGATEAANSLAGRGLLYQWGRKDPFPGGMDGTAGFAALNKFSGMLDAGGTTATITSAMAASTAAAVLLSIENPTMFYVQNATNGNWFSFIDSDADALWGAAKTLYDPCPTGWRVPTSGDDSDSPWYGLPTPSFLGSGNTGGATWSGSFWPAAGRRLNTSGSFFDSVGTGFYWSASVTTRDGGYSLHFFHNFINRSSNFNRANALSVRCVQE